MVIKRGAESKSQSSDYNTNIGIFGLLGSPFYSVMNRIWNIERYLCHYQNLLVYF